MYKTNVVHESAHTSVILFVFPGMCSSSLHIHTHEQSIHVHVSKQTKSDKVIVLGRHEMQK